MWAMSTPLQAAINNQNLLARELMYLAMTGLEGALKVDFSYAPRTKNQLSRPLFQQSLRPELDLG